MRVLAPATVAGTWVGKKIAGRIDQRWFVVIVVIVEVALVAAAVLLLLPGLQSPAGRGGGRGTHLPGVASASTGRGRPAAVSARARRGRRGPAAS